MPIYVNDIVVAVGTTAQMQVQFISNQFEQAYCNYIVPPDATAQEKLKMQSTWFPLENLIKISGGNVPVFNPWTPYDNVPNTGEG